MSYTMPNNKNAVISMKVTNLALTFIVLPINLVYTSKICAEQNQRVLLTTHLTTCSITVVSSP